jgi:TBC1 domain family protein 5
MESVRACRIDFTSLLLEKMRAPDGTFEDGFIIPGTDAPPSRTGNRTKNLERNNPLSLHDEVCAPMGPTEQPYRREARIRGMNGSHPLSCERPFFRTLSERMFHCMTVARFLVGLTLDCSFPDIAYFRSSAVQAQLTNILYLYSVMHPAIGYRQGMHELLASLYYAVDFDSLQTSTPGIDEELGELCDRGWVAADSWSLFDNIMRSAGKWYEWREDTRPPSDSLGQLNEPYVAPILQSCSRVQREMLRRADPTLAGSLERAGIEPQIFGIRWLRLLFTREFNMQDAMLIWDGLFAVDPSLELALWICVAMLIRIRNRLIPSDYSAQLTYLLRYPTPPVSTSTHHATLLLHQALTLQMSPTPSTGAAVSMENRIILNIPVEVPDPPSPSVRRSVRPGEARRRQTLSSDTGASEPGPSRQPPPSFGRATGGQMNLPEMIARNLIDRGEALGINKTIYNAVTEIKVGPLFTLGSVAGCHEVTLECTAQSPRVCKQPQRPHTASAGERAHGVRAPGRAADGRTPAMGTAHALRDGA